MFLFSAVDLACFAQMRCGALPDIVVDPFAKHGKVKVEMLRADFLTRQIDSGLIRETKKGAVLESTLDKTLAPLFLYDTLIKRRSTEWVTKYPYDKIFFMTEDDGVTLLECEQKNYKLTYYRSREAMGEKFLSVFDMQRIGDYFGEPFHLSDDAEVIDRLFADVEKGNRRNIEEFARSRDMEPAVLKEIVRAIRSSTNAVQIEIDKKTPHGDVGILAKVLTKDQLMLRFIMSEDGDRMSFESFGRASALAQLTVDS
jgi:hypothetical protein